MWTYRFFHDVSIIGPLKFSITFKGIVALRIMNYHITNILGIDVISNCKKNKKKNKGNKINNEKTFKSDECVICLTNPPNVLFCNCGHLCLCVECDVVKGLNVCPMCKIENTIKRTI